MNRRSPLRIVTRRIPSPFFEAAALLLLAALASWFG